jgi:phosphoglycerate dehydrogenase-like enzyme
VASGSRRPRVVVIDDWSGACSGSPAIRGLRTIAEVAVFEDHADAELLVERAADADVLIPFRERTVLDAALLARLPRLRLIAQTGGGAAHIDAEAARRQGIAITLTPGASAPGVAELALGLMLAVYHRIAEGDRLVRAGSWPVLAGRELAGRRLGIAGFGAVGRALAPRALAMGMHVGAWSRSLSERDTPPGVRVAPTLEALLYGCDCLSLHVALTPCTAGLITLEKLKLMRPGAVLVNTARAGLVVEDDLLAALGQGILGGAGLDVHASEPITADSPFLGRSDVVLTPHVGWTTAETHERYLAATVEHVRRFLASQPGNGN